MATVGTITYSNVLLSAGLYSGMYPNEYRTGSGNAGIGVNVVRGSSTYKYCGIRNVKWKAGSVTIAEDSSFYDGASFDSSGKCTIELTAPLYDSSFVAAMKNAGGKATVSYKISAAKNENEYAAANYLASQNVTVSLMFYHPLQVDSFTADPFAKTQTLVLSPVYSGFTPCAEVTAVCTLLNGTEVLKTSSKTVFYANDCYGMDPVDPLIFSFTDDSEWVDLFPADKASLTVSVAVTYDICESAWMDPAAISATLNYSAEMSIPAEAGSPTFGSAFLRSYYADEGILPDDVFVQNEAQFDLYLTGVTYKYGAGFGSVSVLVNDLPVDAAVEQNVSVTDEDGNETDAIRVRSVSALSSTENAISLTFTDSRGFSFNAELSQDVQEYSAPKILTLSASRYEIDTTEDESGVLVETPVGTLAGVDAGYSISGIASSSGEELNCLTAGFLSVRHTEEYSEAVSVVMDNGLSPSMEGVLLVRDGSYYDIGTGAVWIRISVSDLFHTVYTDVPVAAAEFVQAVDRLLRSLTFFGVPTLEDTVEIAASKDFRVYGKSLKELFRAITWMPSASDVGAVPVTRKVNGHELSGDVSVTTSDLGLASAGTAKATTTLLSSTVKTSTATNLCSVTLTPGIWVVEGTINFDTSDNGDTGKFVRATVSATSAHNSAHATYSVQVPTRSIDNAVQKVRILSVTENTTVYLIGYQNTGDTVSVNSARLHAVCIK